MKRKWDSDWHLDFRITWSTLNRAFATIVWQNLGPSVLPRYIQYSSNGYYTTYTEVKFGAKSNFTFEIYTLLELPDVTFANSHELEGQSQGLQFPQWISPFLCVWWFKISFFHSLHKEQAGWNYYEKKNTNTSNHVCSMEIRSSELFTMGKGSTWPERHRFKFPLCHEVEWVILGQHN